MSYDLFAKREPQAGSQESKILTHLSDRGPLTALDSLNLYGVMRLAAVVFNLRKAGHDVVTEMVPIEGRDGTAKKIARYSLVRS